MKISIIQCTSLSDVILSTPVLRALNTQLEADIFYITKSEFGPVMQDNPYLKEIYFIENQEDLIKVRQETFDWLIDLQNDKNSKRIDLKTEKTIRFESERFKEWLFVSFKKNKLTPEHIVDQYFETLATLGVQADSLGVDYFIPNKDEVETDWLPESHRNGYVAVCIGAPTNTQKLPTKRIIELCDRINKPIILLGEERDAEIGSEIANFFKHGTKEEESEIEELNKKAVVFNACGKFNINQQASVIRDAAWVFSHENALMHIAAAFKKKTFTIWGSNSPHFGRYPYRTQFVIFENSKLGCRPCSKTGYKQCPKGHFKCMNELTFDFYLPD